MGYICEYYPGLLVPGSSYDGGDAIPIIERRSIDS